MGPGPAGTMGPRQGPPTAQVKEEQQQPRGARSRQADSISSISRAGDGLRAAAADEVVTGGRVEGSRAVGGMDIHHVEGGSSHIFEGGRTGSECCAEGAGAAMGGKQKDLFCLGRRLAL